jgi:allantoin racemase
MTRALVVLNPNSSNRVTEAIDRAVDPLRAWGTPIRCVTLPEGPPGIESEAQAQRAVPPLLDLARRLEPDALGFVIACFGDPGLHALRDETALPVAGIQEAAVTTALRLGHRFGVISILPASVPRHLRTFGAMGVLPASQATAPSASAWRTSPSPAAPSPPWSRPAGACATRTAPMS